MGLVCTVLLTALGPASAGEGEVAELKIVTPERMKSLCEVLATGFSSEHPEAPVTVVLDDTGKGIACLATGSCQVAALPRPVSSMEAQRVLRGTGQPLVCIPVALDAVVFFVHPDAPIDKIDFATLRQIFCGGLNTWDQLGAERELPIFQVVPAPQWGSTSAFERMVLSPAEMGRPALVKPTGLEVISVVAGDNRTVGFCGLGFNRGIKVLAVARDADSEPVLPTRATVQAQTYPVTHYLYWCFAGTPSGQLRELLKYATGRGGQETLRAAELGCVPLPIAPVDEKTSDAKPNEG